MNKLLATVFAGIMLCAFLTACVQSSNASSSESQQSGAQGSTSQASGSASSSTNSTTSQTSSQQNSNIASAVANTIAEDEQALVDTYASKFTQITYGGDELGLTLTFNLFLPEDYDSSKSYPMVVFIADSSCANGDPKRSLTQGLGALVWATDEWQAAYPTIVCVPTYNETILDDHNGYTTTEYVELTRGVISYVTQHYAVDPTRIYGTGQSMGCMTTLVLASEYPTLYNSCMFVDGQWDVSTLQALEGQRFVYFAAEDDERAYKGMNEVMAMFDEDSVAYASAQWDGTWSPDELSAAAGELFAQGQSANFISWVSGTISAGSGGGGRGGAGGASYHMASFDYAYRSIAVMEWLFQQES